MKIKRSFCLSVCAVFIFAGIFAACNSSKKKGITETPTSGLIKISADQTFEPIMEQEIDVFEGLYPKANIIPVYADEVDVITSLLQDSVRLAVTTRRLSPKEVETLNARKLYPKEVKIATDGVALIVNKANPDTLITMDQLRRILTGEVTEWNQVYPESKLGKLQLVFDNPNSSTVRFAIDSICAGKPLSKNLNAQDNNEKAKLINERNNLDWEYFDEHINDDYLSTLDFSNATNALQLKGGFYAFKTFDNRKGIIWVNYLNNFNNPIPITIRRYIFQAVSTENGNN